MSLGVPLTKGKCTCLLGKMANVLEVLGFPGGKWSYRIKGVGDGKRAHTGDAETRNASQELGPETQGRCVGK